MGNVSGGQLLLFTRASTASVRLQPIESTAQLRDASAYAATQIIRMRARPAWTETTSGSHHGAMPVLRLLEPTR